MSLSAHALRACVAAAALGVCMMSSAQTASSAAGSGADSDADLQARVQQALTSNQGIDSQHIRVSVQHGEVQLGGFAQDSRAVTSAYQVATKAAQGHKIVNNIQVNQGTINAP